MTRKLIQFINNRIKLRLSKTQVIEAFGLIFHKYWNITSFVLLAVVSVFTLGFVEARFFINDDWAMRSLADGSFTGNHETELIFVGKIPGILLAFIYQLFPLLPCYELLLLTTNFLAFWLIARESSGQIVLKAAWFFSVITLYTWLIQSPTFTTTAIVSSGIGAAVLVIRGFRATKDYKQFIFPAIVFSLGLSWRVDSLVTALLFAIFLFLAISLLYSRKTRAIFTSFIVSFGLIFVASVAVYASNSICLDSQSECIEWNNWKEYNAIRGTFHGSTRGDYLIHASESGNITGFSSSNAIQFMNWMYFDEKVHGYNQITKLDQQIPNSVLPNYTFSNQNPIEYFAGLIRTAFGALETESKAVMPWLWIMLTIIMPCLLIIGRDRARLMISLTVGSFGPVSILVLASTLRLPQRVLYPVVGLWMLSFLFIAASVKINQSEGFHNKLKWAWIFTTSLTTFVSALILRWEYNELNRFLFWSLVVFSILGVIVQLRHLLLNNFRKIVFASTCVVSGIVLVFTAINLPLGIESERRAFMQSPLPLVTPYSTEIISKWRELSLFAPGNAGGSFLPQAYSTTNFEIGRINFGGWITFSPHWYQRSKHVGAPLPTFEQFISSDTYLLASVEDFNQFKNLEEVSNFKENWKDLGPYFPDSSLRVWVIGK